MPIPALNTGGVDVSNTIAKIEAMKTNQLQRENIANEIAIRTAQSPSLIAERESQNAFRQIQTERETALKAKDKADAQRANMEDISKGLLWLKKSHPAPAKAYATFRNTMTSEFAASGGAKGIHPDMLPEDDLFYTEEPDPITGESVKKWNQKAFDNFADSSANATGVIKNTEDGKAFDLIIKNPKFDPDNPNAAPKYIKQHLLMRNGVPEVVGEGLSPDDDRAEKVATETSRHNQEMEKIGNDANKKQDEIIRHNKEIEKIMLVNAQANKTRAEKPGKETAPKILKNAAGNTLRQLKSGDIEILDGVDDEGQGVWRTATKEEAQGLTWPGTPGKEKTKLLGIGGAVPAVAPKKDETTPKRMKWINGKLEEVK